MKRPKIHVDLPSRQEVRRRIHRDRLLADRSGRLFTVVVFATSGHRTTLQLAQILNVRKRETDEFGPAPREHCVGLSQGARHCYAVLLPETTRRGAMSFAQSVVDRMPEADRPLWTVTTYPEQPDKGDTAEPAIEMPSQTTRFGRPLPTWKRAVDLATAGSAFVILSPLMLLVAMLVKLDSRGPAIFWQQRTGLGGRVFWIAKFRTMVVDAEKVMEEINLRVGSEQDGPAFKLRHDPRVTRFGRLLRQTSLDELPQLWNIVRGDMTLVGPRPLPTSESDACLPWQRRRLDVTPGLTCIWQVHGRSRVLFDDWMRMDLRYVGRSRGLGGVVHDLTLLAKTLPAVFLKRGF
jgi:lipopolysaccharide/colanic/teichoic acid biosynthesis glycosyltransferase